MANLTGKEDRQLKGDKPLLLFGGSVTGERWDDNRLDRLAESVQENSGQIADNSRQIADNFRQIAELRRAIESLVAIAQAHQQSLNAHDSQFAILVQEIRGLRAENRRILSHLFGEQTE